MFSWRFRRGWLYVAILFFAFPPVRCPLQRRNRERYSAVLMSAIERLSIAIHIIFQFA